MKKLLVLLISILISFNSYGEKVLFCNDELATGFRYKNGNYAMQKFTLQRYTIKFNDDYSVLSGLDDKDWKCFNSYFTSEYNSIACESPWQNGASFSFHKPSKRYLYFYSGTDGYIDPSTQGDDLISVGTCIDF